MVILNDRLDFRVGVRVGLNPLVRLGLRLELVGGGNFRIGLNGVFRLRFDLRVGLEA